MSSKADECPLCQIAACLAEKGMIDDDDRVMIRRHLEREHGLRRVSRRDDHTRRGGRAAL